MLSVTFLGTGAACPSVERNVAGLAVQREGETLLFDCGEGTQRQMMRYGVSFAFSEIFFTHYHADHMLGVTGLLRTLGLQDRTAPVVLYGPRGAQRYLGAAISLGIERNRFPVEIIEVKPGDRLARGAYDVVVFETDHRADTVGYALAEHVRLGRFHPERARELGVPEGPLWGRLHRGETVELPDGRRVSPAELVGAPRPGRTVVYTGDTRPCLGVVETARFADLLIHEATFGEEEHARAAETGHSTAAQAAEVAREAGVRRLALTHISPRYGRDAPELLAEAKAVFPETVIARDGLTLDVPFAD
ncbi:MAG TPA: ribonuclease Z [Gemmatimonadales bacterium]|jgi:ribonuclease Z|nr:ribonuclease Z [Gemmatimonadales bacterium]